MSSPDHDTIQRVRIYLTEDDQWEETPLYVAVLERLQQEGATGATALRGLAGFGPGFRMRATGFVGLSEHPPVVIEWIDREDRISHVLPLLDELLPRSLITVEEVQIHRAVMRGQAFSGASGVGDVMRPEPATVTLQTRLSKVIATMLTHNQSMVPVIDDARHLVGIVGEQQFARRVGVFLPMRLLRILSEEEGREFMKPFTALDLSEVVNNEPRSVYVNAAIGQALVTMVEWSYDQIPVLDRAGVVVGLLSRDDVLRASVEQAPEEDERIHEAEPPTLVRLVMQTSVPNIPITESLAFAIQQLLLNPAHSLVIVDSARRVQGMLDDVTVVSHLEGSERTALLSLLQRNETEVKLSSLPGTDRGFADMITPLTTTLSPADSLIDATRRLLELRMEQLPVTDEEGRLVGLIARGGLLRALMQASR